MTVDKRQYERHPYRTDVIVRSGEQKIEAITRDVSLGGMFIEGVSGLAYGSNCEIEFRLPALSAPAKIDAIVRWVAPDGIGVQFGGLRAKETWAINQLVRK